MRYRLRTLMIVLAIGPPVLAWSLLEWNRSSEHRAKNNAEEAMRKAIEEFDRKLGHPLEPLDFPEFTKSPPY